jgi:hypothetical protein
MWGDELASFLLVLLSVADLFLRVARKIASACLEVAVIFFEESAKAQMAAKEEERKEEEHP